MCLGDNEFHRYFVDSNDVSDTRFISSVEILHYLEVFIPNQLSDCKMYNEKAERHIYSLLLNFSELFASKTNAKMTL